MKKNLLILLFGITLSTGVSAQTKDIKNDEKELKKGVKDKKEDRREVGKDIGHLRVKAAMKERKEVKQHRKSIHHQAKHLKNYGSKHPINKAARQLKDDKDMKQ